MTQKTLMVLSGIMRHSQLLGRIPANPVGPVRIKQARRKRAIRPLPPETIERMRALALARARSREAALLSLLAYAGLRPGEAFALRWDCVGDRALIVEHGRADGSLKATKTDRIRAVGLLRPVIEDLEARRAVAPGAEAGLLYPRREVTYSGTRTTRTGAGATSTRSPRPLEPSTRPRTRSATASRACAFRPGGTPSRSRTRWATAQRSSSATTRTCFASSRGASASTRSRSSLTLDRPCFNHDALALQWVAWLTQQPHRRFFERPPSSTRQG
jgi:integrase